MKLPAYMKQRIEGNQVFIDVNLRHISAWRFWVWAIGWIIREKIRAVL